MLYNTVRRSRPYEGETKTIMTNVPIHTVQERNAVESIGINLKSHQKISPDIHFILLISLPSCYYQRESWLSSPPFSLLRPLTHRCLRKSETSAQCFSDLLPILNDTALAHLLNSQKRLVRILPVPPRMCALLITVATRPTTRPFASKLKAHRTD